MTLHPVALAAATHGLELRPSPPVSRPPGTEEWPQVMQEVGRHGLVGLLAAAYEDGVVALTDEQAQELADAHLAAAERALDIEDGFLEALDLLTRLGVPLRVLKGVASAHLDYPEPARRTFEDVDLLIRSADFERVVGALAAAGYPRELPERRVGWDRRFGKDVTVFGPRSVQLDLHRTFAAGAFGLRQQLDDLWDDSSPFVLGGRTVHALVPEDRLLHACFAAVFGSRTPRVAHLRDLAQLLARPDLDADLVIRRAIRWRCVPVLAAALDAARRILGGLPPSPIVGWVTGQRPGWRDRAPLAAYPSHGGSPPVAVLSGVLAVPGLRRKAGFLRALVRPDAGYRRARTEAGRRKEWRMLLGGLARIGRRDHVE